MITQKVSALYNHWMITVVSTLWILRVVCVCMDFPQSWVS